MRDKARETPVLCILTTRESFEGDRSRTEGKRKRFLSRNHSREKKVILGRSARYLTLTIENETIISSTEYPAN